MSDNKFEQHAGVDYDWDKRLLSHPLHCGQCLVGFDTMTELSAHFQNHPK